MTYTKQKRAQEAMAAFANISTAPALAVIHGDGTYRVVEADEEGVVIVRSTEDVIETMWTRHRAGIAKIKVMNAYRAGCGYKLAYVNVHKFRAPHGTTDLGPFLDQVIKEANSARTHQEKERLRSCDDCGETFIAAIYERGDVCPRSKGVPVPEKFSEEGLRPVIVVRTVAGVFEKVEVSRGEAHAIVVDEYGLETARWFLSGLQNQPRPALEMATRFSDAVDLLHDILNEINAYDQETQTTNDTDTGVVWEKFNSWRNRIVQTVGFSPKPLSS